MTETLAGEGDNVDVDAPLAKITPGEKPAAAEAPKAAAPKAEAPKVEAPKAEAPKAEAPKAAAPAPVPKAAAPVAPKVTGSRSENRVKMTRMRQRISQRLKESQNTAAMLTTFQVRYHILLLF